jgi:bis(5'-nucleosidyl)-tetraphosphatase
MKDQRSAGVVVYRPDTNAPGGRMFLLLDYGRYWDLPKGHVEKGEDDLTAALRELHEETGIPPDVVRLVPGFAHEITYFFRTGKGGGKSGLVRKSVIFFLAETDVERVTVSHEHEGHAWLPYEDAEQRLTYANTKAILRAAGARLTSTGGVSRA